MSLNYYDYFYDHLAPGLTALMEDAREGVYKNNYIFRDEIQNKLVHDKLAQPVTQEKIIEFTGLFIDNHSEQLSTLGPVLSFTFGDKETSFFYDLFETSAAYMMEVYGKVVKDTYYGNISQFITGWIKHAPHKILITAILIDALQNRYTDIIECCKYIWAFCEYPIIYSDYWEFGVREDVMAYTMEHLGAKYKFVQKKMKTLKDLLKYHADSAVANKTPQLRTGADNTYIDFMRRIRNQINNSLKNISREYYNNHKQNNTLHRRSSTFDDGKPTEQEGYITNMSQMIDNTNGKLSVNWINNSLLGAAAEASSVDKSILTGYINQIFSTKGNRIAEFVEKIIMVYFNKFSTAASGMNKSEFLSFGLSLYRSLNSDAYSDIKNIINHWMDDIIGIKDVYSSSGTIINYTRSIYNYMIFMIAHYN